MVAQERKTARALRISSAHGSGARGLKTIEFPALRVETVSGVQVYKWALNKGP